MRALAAFLGASDDEDADDDAGGGALATAAEASPRLQTTKPLEKPSAAAGRPETVTGRASASAARPPPRDPDEGGVPMARTGAKWWEAGGGGGDDGDVSRSERDARAPTRNKPTPTASDVEKEPIGLARDFFRAAAPFAPSGTRIASTRVDASAASGAEFPGAGASDDDGDDSVSEEALLRLAGRGRRLRLRVESQSGLLGVGVGRGEWRERERERRAGSRRRRPRFVNDGFSSDPSMTFRLLGKVGRRQSRSMFNAGTARQSEGSSRAPVRGAPR